MSPKETTKSTFERPFSDRWVLKHIRESPIRVALTQLRVWTPDSHKKLDEALVRELKKLPEKKTLQTLHELPQIKRIVKRQNPSAFHLPALIKTDKGTLRVSAQVDSGCTRSMIVRSYAKRNDLNIQPLAIPLEVEGCNSTTLDHVDGKVEACLTIGEHVETITLWTMDLSEDTQVILGYDWLHGHNPTVDWKMGTVSNSMLTDERSNSRIKGINYTGY